MQRYVENEITHAGVVAPPVIPANSPGQVCKALEVYFRQREKLARVGEKGKEWYEKEVKKNSRMHFSKNYPPPFCRE